MILKQTKLGLTIIICAIVGFAIGSIAKGVVIGVIIGIIIGNIMNRKKQLK
jgi:hypothetical protein